MAQENTIALFEWQEIRKLRHNNEWWFVIVDVVGVISNSKDPQWYLKDMRRRDKELSKGWGQFATPLEIMTNGWKQKINCANTASIFRIIQSISSPKAEPFKLRLAQVGYERVQEIEDPELATKRTKALYKAKWYSEDRIEKRMRGIAVREQLTDERSKRWAQWHRDYAILTAEISKATFGMTPSEYKKFKNIPDKSQANLRDNITDLELIFAMLGERATTEITQTNDSQGIKSLKQDAKAWGTIAWDAKKALETKTGKKVVSKENYLIEKERQKLK
jgi:DNA-damage-inducible protein D